MSLGDLTNSRSWSDGGRQKEHIEISGLKVENIIELPQVRGDLALFSVEHGNPLDGYRVLVLYRLLIGGFADRALSMRGEPRDAGLGEIMTPKTANYAMTRLTR
jgi:hypothetical protein